MDDWYLTSLVCSSPLFDRYTNTSEFGKTSYQVVVDIVFRRRVESSNTTDCTIFYRNGGTVGSISGYQVSSW